MSSGRLTAILDVSTSTFLRTTRSDATRRDMFSSEPSSPKARCQSAEDSAVGFPCFVIAPRCSRTVVAGNAGNAPAESSLSRGERQPDRSGGVRRSNCHLAAEREQGTLPPSLASGQAALTSRDSHQSHTPPARPRLGDRGRATHSTQDRQRVSDGFPAWREVGIGDSRYPRCGR